MELHDDGMLKNRQLNGKYHTLRLVSSLNGLDSVHAFLLLRTQSRQTGDQLYGSTSYNGLS